jgi:protein-tyrosine-phosphatase
MSAPEYLLIVCTANICRSPMAAALLRHALAAQPEPLRSLQVVSAGVAAREDEPATENSIMALKKVGLDLSSHVSRPLTHELLNGALAVIAMTESHCAMIQATADPVPEHLLLFRQFVPTGSKEIADPYGFPLSAYEACRDEMVEALPSLISFLRGLVRRPKP